MEIKFLKAFNTQVVNGKLIVTFGIDYLSIIKDEQTYNFVPIEDKKIVIRLSNEHILNSTAIFVFQNEERNRFIKISVFQLMLATNIREHLKPYIKEATRMHVKETLELMQEAMLEAPPVLQLEDMFEPKRQKRRKQIRISKGTMEVVRALEDVNIDRLIDSALENRDEVLFKKLVNMKKRKQRGANRHE